MTTVSKTKEVITPVDFKKRQNLRLRAGDTVRVSIKIQEKNKTRLQAFEGLVLARRHGNEPGATFTVRRMSSGVGVEKIFPLYSPMIDSIEVVRRAKVRQANLYHIRRKAAKEVRRQMKNQRIVSEKDTDQEGEELEVVEEELVDETEISEPSVEPDAQTSAETAETPTEDVKEGEVDVAENADETQEEKTEAEVVVDEKK